MPPNGHKTWQESRDSLIEGLSWMIKHGLFPTFHSMWLGSGSVYGDDPSSAAKLPPTDYFLDVGLGHHQAMMENGMYEKMNKLMFCPLDCLAHFYAGDIGIVELAGTPANWLTDTIPNELNWMASFFSKVDSEARRPSVTR